VRLPFELPNPSERRSIGDYWEHRFCELAVSFGKEFTPHQIGHKDSAACSFWRDALGQWKKQLLPDVVLWGSPSEHYEIKHKNPTRTGRYGYESYRLAELVRFANVTRQPVYYVVHDWQHAGAQTSSERSPNRLEDWFYADVLALNESHTTERIAPSLVAGQFKDDVLQFFWDVALYFRPLGELWNPITARCQHRFVSDLPFCTNCGQTRYSRTWWEESFVVEGGI